MSADLPGTEQDELSPAPDAALPPTMVLQSAAEEESAEDGDDDNENENDEPKLKYAKLTGSLTNIYRNGDSSSAFTLSGELKVLGTHNGNIHVLRLPSLQSMRTYHAHSASITSISVSPTPSTAAPDWTSKPIYIATSSLDGHVCVSSLADAKDVQLRNFARPVQAVALSPDYRNDRTYLSAGLAGSLILTVGGKAGVTADANTNSAAAAASSGFLGALGLGGDKGKDTVLHSGEGAISTIKWSLSSKWVVWVTEEGIKIMRSHLRLGSEESEYAWRRIAHAAKPNRRSWNDMAGVWKARCEWIDERKLEVDEHDDAASRPVDGVNGVGTLEGSKGKKKRLETLVVGWGDTAWVMHVTDGGTDNAGKKQVGSAEIVRKLQFRDCIVSGISLYTPSLLAILAYRTRDDDDKPVQLQASNDTPRKGRHHRQTGLAPQLRLVNVVTGEEDDIDELSISRFETLSAQDYHLATMFIPPPPSQQSQKDKAGERGALGEFWDAAGGKYATRMFSSGASVLSKGSSGKEGEDGKASITSPGSSAVGIPSISTLGTKKRLDAHPFVSTPGLKLFIHSPYDCILAVKRDLKDHLEYLLKESDYAQAWQLMDKHPDIVPESAAEQPQGSQPSSPSKAQGSLAEFFADEAASHSTADYSVAQKEKRRIGDQWLQQLVAANQWPEAGKIAGKVLGTSARWEHWVWTFAQARKFDEITPYIPSDAHLPSLVYEVILGHYIAADRQRLKQLLEEWEPERGLYDTGSVTAAIENRVESGDVKEGSEDWQILIESLAKLYLADAQPTKALKCYLRVQDADKATQLIREQNLMDAIAPEDIPGLFMLRVSREQMRSAPLNELELACTEAVQLLVEQAHRGSVMPATVIKQLEQKGRQFRPFLFFYLRALWRGTPKEENQPRRIYDLSIDKGHALVEDHADLAVELFAEYDRDLLLTFLHASEVYNYEKAAAICENRHFIPEFVYVLSKTGQTKRALDLIINELGDVSQAIAFAKNNPDLWDDLLDYSMTRPSFIRGLLAEVGTAIDPIQLVRRIPEGLEIEGLREALAKMLRDYDIQFSISEGVARVLRGEVVVGMEALRDGRKKAVRFDVVRQRVADVEVLISDPEGKTKGEEKPSPKKAQEKKEVAKQQPGRCAGCGEVFGEGEKEALIGFACGHVFHLSCLLKANPETADPETLRLLLSQLGSGADTADEGYSFRSVGAKVAHAHIIKNVVRGGCRCCVSTEGV